jgi:uncharacterized protein (TIGR03435 family)
MRSVAATIAASAAIALAQAGPTFDVVSIKVNTAGIGPGAFAPPIQRPDGSIVLKNTPINGLIARAYPGLDVVGLPDWARSERYDVSTTSTLTTTATADERAAMMRAMLADRFKMIAHVEPREQDVYNLVLARKDGKLGSGLEKSDADCTTPPPQQPAGRPDFTKPPPPCTIRMLGSPVRPDKQVELGDLVEGEATMATLATALRNLGAGRPVVDKTGLPGTYRIRMNFDMRSTIQPPAPGQRTSDVATMFTAVQEQLGLKLEPGKAVRDTLVIERLEHPTPN